jgi:CRISPR/Cas system-associated exonuclease Cas4 (RecB family)
MSDFYTPKRTYDIYNPSSKLPFKLSRSRIENFISCPRCFYIDRRLGIDKPPPYPYTLSSAVDKLLKKEFDIHRANGTAHPLMKHYRIDAVPLDHKNLGEWRNTKIGIRHLHKPTNLLIFGGIDDVWKDSSGKLIVVDYKSTAKERDIDINAPWQQGYKRQIEIYQWLFRKNNYKVSDIGYFVYANGITDKEAFDGKLEFNISIIPYKGNDSWIEEALLKIKKCLDRDEAPESSPDCDFCAYRKHTRIVEA